MASLSRTKFRCQHISPNFWIKWFYSKITSHDCCMHRSFNHLLWSHANFSSLFADLSHWLFSIKDMTFGHLMVIIPLTFDSTFPFQLVHIADLLPLPWSFCAQICRCRLPHQWLVFGLIASSRLVEPIFGWSTLGPASGRVWKHKTAVDNISHLHPRFEWKL